MLFIQQPGNKISNSSVTNRVATTLCWTRTWGHINGLISRSAMNVLNVQYAMGPVRGMPLNSSAFKKFSSYENIIPRERERDLGCNLISTGQVIKEMALFCILL